MEKLKTLLTASMIFKYSSSCLRRDCQEVRDRLGRLAHHYSHTILMFIRSSRTYLYHSVDYHAVKRLTIHI